MKEFLKILAVVAVSIIAGAYLDRCQHPKQEAKYEPPGYPVIDTIPYYDTIPFFAPDPVATVSAGFIDVTIPIPAHRIIMPPDTLAAQPADSLLLLADMEADIPDSLTLQLPITQNIYESEDYKAYVSGVYPKLDSLFIFAKSEVVTIREPPNKQKRWGIGVFAGYGMTPHGFQPCAGISINYNLWNF